VLRLRRGAEAVKMEPIEGTRDGREADSKLCVEISLPEEYLEELKLLRMVEHTLFDLRSKIEWKYCSPGGGCRPMPDTLREIAEKIKTLEHEVFQTFEARKNDLRKKIPDLIATAILEAVARQLGERVEYYIRI
jgi:hypothetical protein